ncbi:hypothetical protein [uncultured Jatrophihabitans sp.]
MADARTALLSVSRNCTLTITTTMIATTMPSAHSATTFVRRSAAGER